MKTFEKYSTLSGVDLDKLERSILPAKKFLRIAIVTENFLPKVDGVTRTLARLLEHLRSEGHEALVLGPDSGMTTYAGHEIIGTKGIPLLGVYKGLKLNFMRPKFISRLIAFNPDVIQFVDPIWLGAQAIPAIQYYLPNVPCISSYHTNLAMYATLFGFSWLTPTIWKLQLALHSRCELTFCPSPSTSRMISSQGFNNVRLWPRGVDIGLFKPEARSISLRRSWNAENKVVALYCGRISWEKNLKLLVESFRGLQWADRTRPACQLVFVGEGPSRIELEALCQLYELNAIFTGHLEGTDLAAAFASADIFAFPSWTETFGQVVSEALASGCPVVGLRAEGVVDLVKHRETGLLMDMDDLIPSTSAAAIKSPTTPESFEPDFKPLPSNPHSLVGPSSPTFPLAVSIYRSLLIEMATNAELRARMGQVAAEGARDRSWHGAMELLVDGYRQVLRPERTPPNSPMIIACADEKIDSISHLALDDTYAESTPASTNSKRDRVRRVLALGGVLRRSGGRIKEMSIKNHFWRTKSEHAEADEGMAPLMLSKGHTTRFVIKLIVASFILYCLLAWITLHFSHNLPLIAL